MLALFIRALLVASSRSLCCAHEKVIQEKVDLIVTRPKPDRRTFVMANGGNKRDFGEHATKSGNKHDFSEYATNCGNTRSPIGGHL